MDKNTIITLPIDDTVDRRELFGSLDRNLRNIEQQMGVSIIQRDNNLLLKGEDAPKAEVLLKEMIQTLKKGEQLDEQKI